MLQNNVATNLLKKISRLKVLYTDVDNTFVHDGSLFRNANGYSLKNAKGIYRLLSAGVDVVMVSGREKNNMRETARLLGFQNYIGNMGMEIVYEQGKEIVHNYCRAVKSGPELKRWILSTGIAEALFERYPGKIRYYKPWSDNLETHLLMIGELDYSEAEAFCRSRFPELRFIDNGFTTPEKEFKNPHAYHIIPAGTGKRSAVAVDKQRRGLKTSELIAIGDSAEDLTLAAEVSVFFSVEPLDFAGTHNVVQVDNKDGHGFSRIVEMLVNSGVI